MSTTETTPPSFIFPSLNGKGEACTMVCAGVNEMEILGALICSNGAIAPAVDHRLANADGNMHKFRKLVSDMEAHWH